jgi:hypothetical protein
MDKGKSIVSPGEEEVKINIKKTIGLTDINTFEYVKLQKLWLILQQYNKFDNINEKKNK